MEGGCCEFCLALLFFVLFSVVFRASSFVCSSVVFRVSSLICSAVVFRVSSFVCSSVVLCLLFCCSWFALLLFWHESLQQVPAYTCLTPGNDGRGVRGRATHSPPPTPHVWDRSGNHEHERRGYIHYTRGASLVTADGHLTCFGVGAVSFALRCYLLVCFLLFFVFRDLLFCVVLCLLFCCSLFALLLFVVSLSFSVLALLRVYFVFVLCCSSFALQHLHGYWISVVSLFLLSPMRI